MQPNRMTMLGGSLAALLAVASTAVAESTKEAGAGKGVTVPEHGLQSHTDANRDGTSSVRQDLSALMNGSQQQAKELQQALKERGFYAGRVDGIVGDRTREALRKFQVQQGLSTDHGMNDATARALGMSAWERQPVSGEDGKGTARTNVTDPVYRERSSQDGAGPAREKGTPTADPVELARLSSEQKQELQRRLQELGFYRGAIDGVIGPSTRKAVSSYFQRQAELAARGLMDDAAIQVFGVESSDVQRVSGHD